MCLRPPPCWLKVVTGALASATPGGGGEGEGVGEELHAVFRAGSGLW